MSKREKRECVRGRAGSGCGLVGVLIDDVCGSFWCIFLVYRFVCVVLFVVWC